MIKLLARDVLTFDCEWVPDVEAGRRLYDLPRAVPAPPAPLEPAEDIVGGRVIELPAGFLPSSSDYTGFTDRDVTAEMYRRHSRYDEQENPRPFLKPILCEVVSIATVRRLQKRDGSVETTLKVVERATEADRINAFLEGVGKLKPQLVGFNSKDADLPILIQRAMVHRLSQPDFCRRPDKPWEGVDHFAKDGDHHVDLLFQLAGFDRQGKPSLSEACAALNILGGAKDIDGGDVVDLHLAGDQTTIDRYCAKDAVRQHLIFLRLCVLAGFLSPEEEAIETDVLLEQLELYLTPTLAL